MKHWTTFPDLHLAAEGYSSEHFAPGYQEPIFGGFSDYQVVYHYIMTHATTYHLYNKEFREKQNGKLFSSSVCVYL